MDARSMLLAALLSAAASTAPLTARADHQNARRDDPGDDEREPAARRDACARMRAYPAWCRERDERERRDGQERVRRGEP